MADVRLEQPAATGGDFPRSVAGVALVLDFAAEHGLAEADLLQGSGLRRDLLADPGETLPAAAELRVLRNLDRLARGHPGRTPWRTTWALELGERYHLTSFGILGYALLTSRSVLEAINLALRFLDLSYIFTTPRPESVPAGVNVELCTDGLPEDLADALALRDLAAIRTVLVELSGDPRPFASVALALPTPRSVGPFVRALGVEPAFEAARHRVLFRADFLAAPLTQGNPHALAMAEALCRDVVSRRRSRSGITDDVRRWITREVAAGAPMDDAAAALALSTRTLRRRLTAAGTSYQGLVDEVRQALAEELLATDVLSVEDVALRLGYAEASSFIHAFKRWTGRTPHGARSVSRASSAARAPAG